MTLQHRFIHMPCVRKRYLKFVLTEAIRTFPSQPTPYRLNQFGNQARLDLKLYPCQCILFRPVHISGIVRYILTIFQVPYIPSLENQLDNQVTLWRTMMIALEASIKSLVDPLMSLIKSG